MNTNKVQEDYLKEFKQLFDAGMDHLYKAADKYVEAIDRWPEMRSRFKELIPEASENMWYSIEKMGRGQLDKRLFIPANSACLKLQRFPLSIQRDVLDNGVDVFLRNGDSVRIPVQDLLPEQAKQVFAFDKIRSQTEQISLIRENDLKLEVKESTKRLAGNMGPYIVNADGTVTVPAAVVLSRNEAIALGQAAAKCGKFAKGA